MADVVVDGREIEFDLNRISIREYRALFDPAQPDEEEYAAVAKISGLTVDEVAGLGVLDYRKLVQALFRKAREPLADPN